MTDKELRKLSRLELLELLLEASKENEMLRAQVEELKIDNKTARTLEVLSVVTRQVENTLKYANSLTDTLKPAAGEATVSEDKAPSDDKAPSGNKAASGDKTSSADKTPYGDGQKKSSEAPAKTARLPDREIYKRMLCFFANNEDKLSVFPADIENDVKTRIRSILENIK